MTDWLLAFFVHSTLWLGLAWVWLRIRPGGDARVREVICYTAIFASLVTPTVQVMRGADASAWHLHVPSVLLSSDANESALDNRGEHGVSALSSNSNEHHNTTSVAVFPWIRVGCTVLWTLMAGAFLLRYFRRLKRFHGILSGRHDAMRDSVTRVTRRLSAAAGLPRPPRITASDAIRSPVALGLGRDQEICVPTRALHDLDADELSALLGHEIAHHKRQDVLRLGFLNVLQAVFFFQPLLRGVLKRIHLAVEEQCDLWAAAHIDDRLAMASCLAEVAGWVTGSDRAVPVPCMARPDSHLEVRVRKLIDDKHLLSRASVVLCALFAVALMGVGTWLAPGLVPNADASHALVGHEPHRKVEERHRSRSHREHERRERRGHHERGEHHK